METIGIFIAVLAVLIIMDGFFFLILWGMVSTVRRFAKNNALRQAGIFDELLFNKEETLRDIERQIIKKRALLADGAAVARPEAATTILKAPDYQAISTGFYKDADFVDEYRALRRNFVLNEARVIKDVLQRIPADIDERAQTAQSILDSLSAEDIYQLSTLSGEEQESLLRAELNAKQVELLDAFLATGVYFECYEFVGWLRQYVFQNGSSIVVRTSRTGRQFDFLDERIATNYDKTLCEGINIRAKGKLYDFSIRNREIIG